MNKAEEMQYIQSRINKIREKGHENIADRFQREIFNFFSKSTLEISMLKRETERYINHNIYKWKS